MSMTDWAERECRLACKRENPNFDFDDEKAWDYGCSCYKSALKAYKSLMDDGHSGTSFGFTKNILIRLMEGQPLTPITDEDFFSVERGTEKFLFDSEEYLKERGLKSDMQCPRMYSLFRRETLDGKVFYYDNDRAYFIDIEAPDNTFSSWCGFLDDMFPITMPYIPQKGKYKIYAQTFLTNEKHGDFDTRAYLYVITPSGEKIDINLFQTESPDGKWIDIPKDEYDKLLAKRIDTVSKKVADKLLWTLLSNSSSEEEIERRDKKWKALDEGTKADWYKVLENKCLCFEKEEFWQYNTFRMRQALCCGREEVYKGIPELVTIAEWLAGVLYQLDKVSL